MKKAKNIFLTTLSETRDRLNVSYYVCEDASGTLSYTTGISVTEAGIKYILSQQKIDEIVMIGSAADTSGDEVIETPLYDVPLSGAADLSDMSEYSFLNYRISEFRNQVDMEIFDITERVPDERRAELIKSLNDFRIHVANDVNFGEMFLKLCTDKNFADRFTEDVLSTCNEWENAWIKQHIYSKMDSFYKMHLLEENDNTLMKYISIPAGSNLTIDVINSIVNKILSSQTTDVNLYMDIQGLGAIDGNTLINTFLLLSRKIGYGCEVKGVINSSRNPLSFAGKVSNMIQSYEIQNLISGIDIFLKYGKVDMLKTYWKSLDVSNPDADRLFYGMDCIDEGISLCNVDLIACGIKVIKKTIQNPRTAPEDRNIYLKIMINAITTDYGALLEGEDVSIAELLRWSHRKGLYQQTLTIIESKVPEDIVKRGIYYYARGERDIKALMKEFNYLYWNEQAKMRWAFNDIEHYFIKLYGRSVLDYRQKPDMVARDYATLRINALHGQADGILPAYSELHNDDMLYELLLGYYRIGNLRNQVNHAEVDEPNTDLDDLGERKDNRKLLDSELNKFINLYSAVCKKTKAKVKPYLLYSGKMKAYVRHHELKPLEEVTDLTAKNTYSCQFNGKEVKIDITLYKPEPDQYVEDDE